MILNECKQEVIISSGGFKETEFKLKNKEFIFDILSDKIYTNKIGAIVREIISNAIDANIESKSTKKIQIHFPIEEEPYFSIRDFGPGLNSERVKVFVSFGDSTKRESADQIGYFGMGSKSPFAYTDSFYITTWVGGHKNEYMAYIGDDRKRSLMCLNKTKDDCEYGTEIKINIKSHSDFSKFREEFYNIFGYCINNFDFNEQYNHLSQSDYMSDLFQSLHSKFDVMFGRYEYCPKNAFTVMNGNVAYQLCSSTIYQLNNYFKMGNTIKYFHAFSNQNIVLKFKVGELKLSVSRESLEICEQNAKAIELKLVGLYDEIYNNLNIIYKTTYGNVVKMRYFEKRFTRILNKDITLVSSNSSSTLIEYKKFGDEISKFGMSDNFNVMQSQNYFYYIQGEINSVEGRIRRFFNLNKEAIGIKFIKFESKKELKDFKLRFPYINLCNLHVFNSIPKKREKKENDQRLIDSIKDGHISIIGQRLTYEHFVNEAKDRTTDKYYCITAYNKLVVDESLLKGFNPYYIKTILEGNVVELYERHFDKKLKIFKFSGSCKSFIPKHWIPIEKLYIDSITSDNIPERTYHQILHMRIKALSENRKFGIYLPDKINQLLIYTYFKLSFSERTNRFKYYAYHITSMNLICRHNKKIRDRLAKDLKIIKNFSRTMARTYPGIFIDSYNNIILNQIRNEAEKSAIKMIKETFK